MNKWTEITERFTEANFLQSPEYGKMNEILKNKVIYEDFNGAGWAVMIVRNAKRGRYLEIPCGPLLDWKNQAEVKAAFDRIREIAKQEKCVFVRIRPQLVKNEENLKILTDLGLKKSPMHLAAEHTVIIDLNKSEDELLNEMRRQTRYEVRRAGKLGIEVICDNSEEIFREFFKIQAETAARQKFIPPSFKTLLAEKEAFGKNAQIYVARIKDEDSNGARSETPKKQGSEAKNNTKAIAYGLIIKNGKEADYYEAASTELNHKLPGAYALLWQAMKDLKKEGYTRFNLWGIAPPNQPDHRYAGVTTFKTGFGGEIVEFVPAHDLVISKIKYLKNLIVETARKKWRHL